MSATITTTIIPCTRCGSVDKNTTCTWPSGIHNIKEQRILMVDVPVKEEEKVQELPFGTKCVDCTKPIFSGTEFGTWFDDDAQAYVYNHIECPDSACQCGCDGDTNH